MITDGPEPKHAQLRAILEQRCATELKPGDPLPGERALEEEYGVSRITVRRAIGDLVQAGRLRRVRGKGTFVAPAPLVSSTHVASLSDAMRDSDVRATARVLAAELAAPPAEISEFFRTPAGTRHAHLQRLRLGDGQPYGIDDAWYNARWCRGCWTTTSRPPSTAYCNASTRWRLPRWSRASRHWPQAPPTRRCSGSHPPPQ